MLGIEKIEDIARFTEFVFVPTNDAEYEQILCLLDEVTDVVRNDETHALRPLMDVLGVLVEAYERQHVPDIF